MKNAAAGWSRTTTRAELARLLESAIGPWSGGALAVAPLRTDDHHRAAGVMHDARGNGTEEHPGHATQPPRANDQQVRALRLSQDHVGGGATDDSDSQVVGCLPTGDLMYDTV